MTMRGREFGLERHLTDDMVQRNDAALSEVATALSIEWEKAKEQYGLPAGARPTWTLRWYYMEEEA